MTVAELIEKLKALPQDAVVEVIASYSDGEMAPVADIERAPWKENTYRIVS